jgi:prepilin-type N-terminal cleavage/methylation domain-containing protein
MNLSLLKIRRVATTRSGERGFTLVEVVVTLALFSFMMMGVGTIFVQTLRSQRRGAGALAVQENITFVLESIAREIRVSKITPGQNADCVSVLSNSLNITHPVNGIVDYSSSSGVVYRQVGGVSTPMSSSNVYFTQLSFCVIGSGVADDTQARVAIIAKAQSVPVTDPNVFSASVETTVSSRDVITDLQN